MMEYQKLLAGEKIPILGLGTWGFGGMFEKDSSNELQDIETIKKAISLGYTHIDTAEMYGDGFTEVEVGKAIREFSRESLFVTTKVWKDNLRYDDVIKSANKSLQRMKTPYIDLYLIHWPNESIPLEETLRAMEKLMIDGKVKAIGLSNFSVDGIEKARSLLKKEEISAVQNEYNLLSRGNQEVLEYCKKLGIVFVAYRPLGKGDIVSKPSKTLLRLAKEYGKSPAQVALKWVVGSGAAAIVKASDASHLKENLDIFSWDLSRKDMAKLESLGK